jgi:sialic acid synthase SpsE
MRNLGCKNWKIGSGEVFSDWIIKEILKKKDDGLIISSGMSTWTDLKKNYELIKIKKVKILLCFNVHQNIQTVLKM